MLRTLRICDFSNIPIHRYDQIGVPIFLAFIERANTHCNFDSLKYKVKIKQLTTLPSSLIHNSNSHQCIETLI